MSTNANEANTRLKFKVGLFALASVLLLGAISIFVNNRPFWWRSCEAVMVTVEDATGLKKKAPVRSIGLEVGYIDDIGMVPNGVRIRICVTAPVEVLPETKAFVRGEGFLGDRFLELKPMKYIGNHKLDDSKGLPDPAKPIETGTPALRSQKSSFYQLRDLLWINDAVAADVEAAPRKEVQVGEKATDMQQVMTQLNGIMTSLKDSIKPEEIRTTIKQLNETLKDASKAFSPQGGLTATAQRSLIKLEDAIEQMRDQMTRINQGQGSVGMVLNDPYYAEGLKQAITSVNKILGRASEMKLMVDLGINELPTYSGARSAVNLEIWPKADRYYKIGVASDPRGTNSQTINTVTAGGVSNTVQSAITNKGGFVFTVMLGKVFAERFDVSLGLLNGDGAASAAWYLGWDPEKLQQLQLKGDLYFHSQTVNGNWTAQGDGRIYGIYQPFSILYVSAGVEGFSSVNGGVSAFYGAGLRFEDEDIRLLFAFK